MRMSAQRGAVVAFELPYDASMIMFSTTPRKDLTCLTLVDLISSFFSSSFLYQRAHQSQSNNLVFISEWTSRLQPAISGRNVGRRYCFNSAYVLKNPLFVHKSGYTTETTDGKHVRLSRKEAISSTKNNIHANAGQRSREHNRVM